MRQAISVFAALMMIVAPAALGADVPAVIRDAPPMRSPQESLAALKPRPGFQVELMAAEPLVMDPVDVAWGPDGRAWVAEMADYPLGEDDQGTPCGRVRYLEDTDGDGRYDKSTLFLDKLSFPNGVMPWRNGVLVTSAPEVFYAEDTDGDGAADLRRALFVGFGEGNQQHRVNHLRFGLDNWVYMANGDGGAGANGVVRSVKTGKSVDIRGRDVRVRPDDGSLDVVSGQSQFGRDRDDWGNWFGLNNNDPGWHYAVVDHFVRRNPYVAAPPGRISLSANRTAYPAGHVISHRSIDQPAMLPEGQPGVFTSLGGMAFYRDELFGPEFVGNYFASDSVLNVVHRMVVRPDGVTFRGSRAPDEHDSEFLASHDPYFRANTLRTGPDGALWVVDIHRVVIEHPEWIGDELEKLLDLRQGHDRGRIYRVFPEGVSPRSIPRLDRLDTAELVAALDAPGGWQRDMVQQMLLWRNDKAAVGPLEKMVEKSDRALARLHALCTLDGLGVLSEATVLRVLADEHPGVRRHAVRLSPSLLEAATKVGPALLRLVDDPDAQVRLQLAYTLGEWNDPRAGRALAVLGIRAEDDPYMSAAVMSSALPHVESMRAAAKAHPEKSVARAVLLRRLEQLSNDMKASPVAGPADVVPVQRPAGMVNVTTSAERQAAMEKFRAVLDIEGDPDRGREVFVEATCSTCHRFGDSGTEIGPAIATLIDRSPRILFTAVLDPNHDVKHRYVQVTAVTTDGLTVVGLPVEETSNSLTLVDVGGNRHVLLRKDLEELISTGRSHMPEGLEGKLSLRQMADLFAFLGGTGQRPAVHRPELIRPLHDGSLQLSVHQAEIHGSTIKFNPDLGIVAWYRGRPDDHLAWTVEAPAAGGYEVWIEWAQIDQYADNPFAVEVEGGSSRVTGRFPSTGGWETYGNRKFGSLQLAAGRQRIVVRADGPIKEELSDIRCLRLVAAAPVKKPAEGIVARQGDPMGPRTIRPAPGGTLSLTASAGEAVGPKIRYMPDKEAFGCLTAADHVVWSVEVPEARAYDVWIRWALPDEWGDNPFTLEAGPSRLAGVIPTSGGWDEWAMRKFGALELSAGRQQIVLRPGSTINKELCDLAEIWLVPPADRHRPLVIPPGRVPGNRPRLVEPQRDGSLLLEPATCEIHGARITINPDFDVLVWHFDRTDDRVVWSVEVTKPGSYDVWIEWAQIDEYADNPFAVEVEGGSSRVTGRFPSTGGWETYGNRNFGTLELDAGRQQIAIRADGPIKEELSDLRRIHLVPSE